MLTFNNKILTVSNKGLEVEAGPTPPAPTGPVLLYEQAPQSYSSWSQILYEPRTLTTDKDFICYKMSIHHNTNSSPADASLSDSTGNYGWNYSVYREHRIETMNHGGTSNTPLVAGQNGVETGSTLTTSSFMPDTTLPISTTDFTIVRFIFQKSTRKVYFYIDGLQVAICNDWGAAFDPFAQNLHTINDVNETFGIQIYACDTLTDAEGV